MVERDMLADGLTGKALAYRTRTKRPPTVAMATGRAEVLTGVLERAQPPTATDRAPSVRPADNPGM